MSAIQGVRGCSMDDVDTSIFSVTSSSSYTFPSSSPSSRSWATLYPHLLGQCPTDVHLASRACDSAGNGGNVSHTQSIIPETTEFKDGASPPKTASLAEICPSPRQGPLQLRNQTHWQENVLSSSPPFPSIPLALLSPNSTPKATPTNPANSSMTQSIPVEDIFNQNADMLPPVSLFSEDRENYFPHLFPEGSIATDRIPSFVPSSLLMNGLLSASSEHQAQTARPPSVHSTSLSEGVKGKTARLPLHLPRPPLALMSDPYDDLASHLRKHRMDEEAEDFEMAGDITPDFALDAWAKTIDGGQGTLLSETSSLLTKDQAATREQLKEARERHKMLAPDYFVFAHNGIHDSPRFGLEPSHILAVYQSEHDRQSSRLDKIMEGVNKDRHKYPSSSTSLPGFLVPCHNLMYVLQCCSLPAFPTRRSAREEAGRTVPVVHLRVPKPEHFPLTHEFLYLRDSSALLCSILPIRHIARHYDKMRSRTGQDQHTAGASESQISKAPSVAIEAMSYLPTRKLLEFCKVIHGAWANGVAIGLLNQVYWTTLNRGWNLIVGSLSVRQSRQINAHVSHTTKHLGQTKI